MKAPLLKWPRTFHHALSPGLQNDDRRLPTTAPFFNADGAPKRVVATIKVDGENATMTREVTYPRSPDGRYHPSRDLMKAFHASRAHMIPEGWRVCGEYAYAKHAIAYTRENGNALPAWFMGFGVWDETNALLPWDDTLEIFEMLDIVPVRTIHDGPYSEDLVARLAHGIDTTRQEGFVVRVAEAIPFPEGPGAFFTNVFKWVRPGHVPGDTVHWSLGQYNANEMTGD